MYRQIRFLALLNQNMNLQFTGVTRRSNAYRRSRDVAMRTDVVET
ncbi:hypothetical protein [Fischerella sp. NIES-3754]|nr:hypothetical protein [Fischerella sp. NIES-3754]